MRRENRRGGLGTVFMGLLTTVFVAAVSSRTANSQVLYGSIVGAVSDQTQAAVPDATVTIANSATGQRLEATSDAMGRFSVVDLLPGTYDVSITAAGFKAYSKTGIEITINTVTRVEAELQVGALTENVTVSAQATALQTDKGDVHAEQGDYQSAAAELSEFPVAAQPGARGDARRVHERRGRHAAANAY